MIKSQGADAFRDVIHNAIDYFDFQVEIRLPDPAKASSHERWTLMNKIAEKLLFVEDNVQRRIITEQIIAGGHLFQVRTHPDIIQVKSNQAIFRICPKNGSALFCHSGAAQANPESRDEKNTKFSRTSGFSLCEPRNDSP